MRVYSTLVEAVSYSFNLIRSEKLRGGRLVKLKGTVASHAPFALSALIVASAGSGAFAACTDATTARANGGSVCVAINTTYTSAGGSNGVIGSAGVGSKLTLSQSSVTATATSGTAVVAQNRSTMIVNSLTARSGQNNDADALQVYDSGTVMTVNGNLIAVRRAGGSGGNAINVQGGGVLRVLGNLNVVSNATPTPGVASARGIVVGSGGVIDIDGDTSVTTSGLFAHGVVAAPGGKINATTVPTPGSALATFNNLTVSTSGVGSYGMWASGGMNNALIVNGQLSVTTTNAAADAIYSTGGDILVDPSATSGTANSIGEIVLRSGTVTTQGQSAMGVHAAANGGTAPNYIDGASITLGGTSGGPTISTAGIGATAVLAESTVANGSAVIDMQGGNVYTIGGQAHGLQALTSISGNASITLSGGTVAMTGPGAHALDAEAANGAVTVVVGPSATATATGADSTGVRALSMTGGDVSVTLAGTVTGGSGTGLAVETGTAAGQTSSVTIGSGADIGAGSGVALTNNGGDSDVQVSGSAIVRGSVALAGGSDDLLIDGADMSQMTTLDGGDDLSSADGFVDTLTLKGLSGSLTGANFLNWENVVLDGSSIAFVDNQLVTGSDAGNGLSLVNSATLDAGSGFALTGNLDIGAGSLLQATGAGVFSFAGSVGNAGTMDFRNGVAGDQITVGGDYVGAGGALHFDTSLGGDGSATDFLHVFGNVSGTTLLYVQALGGAGAQTAQGIKLVQVDGTSSATAFSLGNSAPLEAGAYVYGLSFSDPANAADQSWYLRSVLKFVPTPGGGGGAVPVISAMGALYESAPNALLGALANMPRLESRIGDSVIGGWGDDGDRVSWVRFAGDRASTTPDQSTSGASYDASSWSMQAGLTLGRIDTARGEWVIGVTAQSGQASVDTVNGMGRGAIDARSYGLGATATWYGDQGSYLDLQAQVNRISADFETAAQGSLARDIGMTEMAVSAEIGHRYRLSETSALVPQAQITFAHLSGARFTDSQANSVDIAGTDRVMGRIGLAYEFVSKGSDDASAQKIYVIGNLLHDFSDESTVTLSGAKLTAKPASTFAEIGLGGAIQLDEGKSIYGEASYRSALNGGGSDGASVAVGFKMEW
jgi:outer membrane autotransporter protein